LGRFCLTEIKTDKAVDLTLSIEDLQILEKITVAQRNLN
jgi:hypothetical protein